MLIERPPKIFRWIFHNALFRMPNPEGERRIYLTFDDGPIPESTPWVLDVLDRYGIKATFFMVGDNVRKYPHLYEEIRRRGHAVANHTMHHLRGSHSWTRKYIADIREAAGYIDSRLVRPPHGWMRPLQIRFLRKNFRIVMFDLVTRDYSKRLVADDVFNIVTRFARPGSIVVFHDSLKSIPRRDALPRSIEWLIDQGYTFHTLNDNV